MMMISTQSTNASSALSSTKVSLLSSKRNITKMIDVQNDYDRYFPRNSNKNERKKKKKNDLMIRMSGTGKFIVGGNWKCNGTRDSVKELVAALNSNVSKVETENCEIYVCPSFLHLNYVKENIDDRFNVCAQNSWVEASLVDPEHHYDSTTGAFTGEISVEMLEDLGIPWVLLGHSERRTLLGDTDAIVGKKVAHARYHGLNVVVCVGESLDERENGTTFDVIYKQLKAVAKEIDDREHSSWGSSVVIAYEPIWAIGTGKVATPDQVQEVHSKIRKWLKENVSAEVAKATRIQYGGSVNAGNCAELAKLSDIDGFLVGGASLNGEDFSAICNASSIHYKAIGR